MTYNELIERFIELYGGTRKGIRIFEAPGRVNLIGEHIDYNGGHVFPAALSFVNTVIARPNGTDRINMAVTSLPDRVSAEIRRLEDYKALRWGNYQCGVAYMLKQAGYEIPGCDLLYHGTVPYGAGLSSSASIEVATAITLAKLGGRDTLDMKEIVLLCQKAENEYVGMKCGIMDQFISALGKKDHAVLLDCDTLDYQYVPVELGEYTIVIANTNKPHKLTESQYNERRSQCERALFIINAHGGSYRHLCDMGMEELSGYRQYFEDEAVYRRARHAVSEDERTLRAVDCLRKGDLAAFGRLLCEAHISMRDDYEATGPELDTLFELAMETEGVLGSRMTGAGFGGCTISIVRVDRVEAFQEKVREGYTKRIGYEPSFYISRIGDGGHEVISW
jgi:galactokinase